MATVFDSEQWTIQRMYEARDFAGLKNVVDVQPDASGNRRDVLVAIPTDLFKYVREVMGMADVSDLRLYLDHLDDDRYVFGVATTGYYHDLWIYKHLPKWALDS